MNAVVAELGYEYAHQQGRPNAVRVHKPHNHHSGLIIACPHSGRFYPPELLKATVLDQLALRRSEDAFVDILFQDAPDYGAILLVNEFARAFVDVNRSPGEMDPKLISSIYVDSHETSSDRVKAGLGVIPRTVGDNVAIYRHRMAVQEAVARLSEVHHPWHGTIETCMTEASHMHGCAVLLDCHSMPSRASGHPSCDIVLGDRFGASCAPDIMRAALDFLRSAGLKVARNNPYAGGYSMTRHGQPLRHHHAIQIEINRCLYMIEGAMTLRPSARQVRETMAGLVSVLSEVLQTLSR
jgi:N-formylglutamate amidohydrolase